MASMSEGSRDIFAPRRLRMARDLAGISQRALAEVAHVTPATISLYETGRTRPPVKTLHTFAEHLNVDVAFFSTSTRQVDVPAFFRSLRAASALERRRALHMTEVVREIVETLETEVKLPDLDLPRRPVGEGADNNTAEAARLIRKSWGLPPGPISHMVLTVERRGIVVARPRQGDSRIDAYSVRFPQRPVIVMSSAKWKRDRSRFDVAHELGHLVMHEPAQATAQWMEKQAQRFAAEFLMPEQDIREDLQRATSLSHLFDVKRKWGTSLAALTVRQHHLGILDADGYTSRMKAISARGWRRHEPVDLGEPESPILLKSAMQVAGLDESDLAQRTGFTIDLVRNVLDSIVDTRPLVEI